MPSKTIELAGLAVACISVVLVAAPSRVSARVQFRPESYYGEPSAKLADRRIFRELEQRFADRPYRSVRRQLIASGYRPVALKRVPDDMACPSDAIRTDYPETLVCSGTGIAGRAFILRRPKSRGYAIVVTYGEETIRVTHLRAATKEDLEILGRRQSGRNQP